MPDCLIASIIKVTVRTTTLHKGLHNLTKKKKNPCKDICPASLCSTLTWCHPVAKDYCLKIYYANLKTLFLPFKTSPFPYFEDAHSSNGKCIPIAKFCDSQIPLFFGKSLFGCYLGCHR
jgi:hypothetical protein